jgi:hypothetical protein
LPKKSKPYDERSDLQRIQSQWNKLSGLHSREEWSSAIVRAATAAELAANFAIRREFETRSQLDREIVDTFLIWANGLSGKLDRLLGPLARNRPLHGKIKELKKAAPALVPSVGTSRRPVHSSNWTYAVDVDPATATSLTGTLGTKVLPLRFQLCQYS